jgi:hypothetical protein
MTTAVSVSGSSTSVACVRLSLVNDNEVYMRALASTRCVWCRVYAVLRCAHAAGVVVAHELLYEALQFSENFATSMCYQ